MSNVFVQTLFDVTAERDQLRVELEECKTLLRTLLHLHKAEVWVKAPWDKTFELVKERLEVDDE